MKHMRIRWDKSIWALNIMFFVVQVLITLGFILKGEWNFTFSPIVTSILFLGLIFLENITDFQIKIVLRLLIVIFVTSHNLIGEYLHAYETIPLFDNILHLMGSFIFALLSSSILVGCFNQRIFNSRLLVFIFVLAMGISLGTLFELVEFGLDIGLNENNQRGLLDTNVDLIFNVVGALLAAVTSAIKWPYRNFLI